MMQMGFSEHTENSFLKFVIIVFFLCISVLFLKKYFARFIVRTAASDDDAVSGETTSTKNEPSTVEKVKEQLIQLQDLVKQISEEKAIIVESEKTDQTAADQTLTQLSQKYVSIQDGIASELKLKNDVADLQFGRCYKMMDVIREELLLFAAKMMESSEAQDRSFRSLPERRHLAESTTQTEEIGEDLENQSNDENLQSVVLAIKDCMETIVQESENGWKNNAQEVWSLLKQNHQTCQNQLNVTLSENLKKNLRENVCDFLIMQADDIEGQLLEVFLFLDRQLVEVKTVGETLKFFNRKFTNFAEKCDVKWEDSCAKYRNTSNLVEDAHTKLDLGSRKMSEAAISLAEDSTELEDLTKGLGVAVQNTTDAEKLKQCATKHMEQVSALVENMKGELSEIEGQNGAKLGEATQSLLAAGRKMESLLQYIEDLEVLNDLVKNIASTYEAIHASSPSLETPRYSMAPSKHSESVVTVASDLASCQEDFHGTGGMSEFSDIETSTCNSRLIPPKRILSILEFMRTSSEWNINDFLAQRNRRHPTGIPPAKQPAPTAYGLNDGNFWGAVPSEIALTDFNSDCLISNSSSSASED